MGDLGDLAKTGPQVFKDTFGEAWGARIWRFLLIIGLIGAVALVVSQTAQSGQILFGLFRAVPQPATSPPPIATSQPIPPLPKTLPRGAPERVTVSKETDCLVGYTIIAQAWFSGQQKAAISAPAGTLLCIVDAEFRDQRGNAIELRDPKH